MTSEEIRNEAEKGLYLCQHCNLEGGIKHLLIAAENDNIEAMINLGVAYDAIGNQKESFYWTKKAADKDSILALENLARAYRFGIGTKCNVEKAVNCGKKLISLGYIDKGYNQVFLAYFRPTDKKQVNEEMAFKCAKEGALAVMENNPEPKPNDSCDIVVQLAICYDFGVGTDENVKAALKYYSYGIRCLEKDSMYNAACRICFSDTKVTGENPETGINLFITADAHGSADSCYQLGRIFYEGKLVKKDIMKSKYYLAKRVRFGYVEQHYKDAVKLLSKIDRPLLDRAISGKYCDLIDF